MSDRWDDRDRGDRDRSWNESDRWRDERERDRDREGRRRSVLSGRNFDTEGEREQDRGWIDRDRDRGWGSGWGETRERLTSDRDERDWSRYREGGRSLTIGRGELTGEGRDRDDDRRRWENRDREPRGDDRSFDRERWGRAEHFGDRDRDREHRFRGDETPSFTGAGGTWSAGHSGAAGHGATGGMTSWTSRDRYEDRERRGSFAGRGPKNYRRSDDRICEDAVDRLTRHPEVDASDVDVTAKDGEVTLTGVVLNRHERRAAEDVVWEVWGVREVHNNLRVQSREDRGVLDKVADAFRGDNR